ncbi:MAG: FAD-dependent oxidoreductase, partial [Sedimentisphaerales bacterium]|nr:FAD-dependent oxidoreductase [Sedimentisphaerales bacterium]
MVKKIVVVGGNAAGMMAAIAAAKFDPTADVTVITADRLAYRRPAIPDLIAGNIKSAEDAAIFSSDILSRYNIKLICPATATNIDAAAKTIHFEFNGRKDSIAYDSAIIATGGTPAIPNTPGADKKGVCTFTTFEAAKEIIDIATNGGSAVVVGAGFIALEIAEALMHKGMDVYFNMRSRILRRVLEPQMSDYLCRHFEQRGLKILSDEAISEIGGEGRVEYVVHKGKKIAVSLVVMGTGVKPNVALTKKCGIVPGATGAIKVDHHMRTSVADIYAAGDCAESPDLDTGAFIYSPVASIGAMAGKIAGQNAAGGDVQTKGFLRAQGDKILGLQIFSVGHSTITAKEVNLPVTVRDLEMKLPEHQGGSYNRFEMAKLLTDSNESIVGGQLIA